MQRVTLKKVGQRALKDKAFFDGLVKDASGALERAKMSVKESDLRAVKRAVARKGHTKLANFIRRVHVLKAQRVFGEWDPDWLVLARRRAARAKGRAKRAAKHAKRTVKRAAKHVRAHR